MGSIWWDLQVKFKMMYEIYEAFEINLKDVLKKGS